MANETWQKTRTVGELKAALANLDDAMPVVWSADGGRTIEYAENADGLMVVASADGRQIAMLQGSGWCTEIAIEEAR